MAERHPRALAHHVRRVGPWRVSRSGGAMCRDAGQAIVELPIALTVATLLILTLLQTATLLVTKVALNATAASLARIASTALPYGESSPSAVLRAYALGRLSTLPRGSAFCVPETLKVTTRGGPRSATVSVTVSVEQRAFPVVGWAFSGGQRAIVTESIGTAPGAEARVAPSFTSGEVIVGEKRAP